MPPAPAGRGPARLLRALASAAAALPLAVAAPALADEGAPADATVVGQLVQAYPEFAREDAPLAAAPLSWIQPASGGPVRVDTGDVGGIAPGSTVRITVSGDVRDAGAGHGFGAARSVTAASVLAAPDAAAAEPPAPAGGSAEDGAAAQDAAPGTATDHAGTADLSGAAADLTDRVTVVLVVPKAGRPDSTSLQGLVDAVDGPVHDFWAGQTDGAIRVGVTAAHGWVTTAAGCTSPTAMWKQAAAAVGFTPGPGRHLLLYLSRSAPSARNCSLGLGEVGADPRAGGRLYVRDVLPTLIAHEIGHNFGLGHSSGRQCDQAVDTGSCRTAAYRDYYDVMGASWRQVGTLNAPQEARLGVLPRAQLRTVAATDRGGSVTLAPLSGRSGIRAVELTAAHSTRYWLEYRSASGQDAWLGDRSADWLGLQTGVLLHRSGALPDTSLLLDGTPSAAARWDDDLDVALPLRTPVHLAGGFTVTVSAVSSRGARVTVTTAAPARAAAPAQASTAEASGALPGGNCASRGDCADRRTGGAAVPAAPHRVERGTPDTVAAAPSATAATAAPARRAPAQAAPMALAALRTPTVVTALTAGGCAVLLLGGVLALRRGARRR